MRIAIVHKEKCRPGNCGLVCQKYCPVNRKELQECVVIEGKAKIDEKLCVGCGICQRRCPEGAIEIINVPEVDEKNLVYRYGENEFALYGLPVLRDGVLGLLGRNGIGKSTAIEILAGKKEVDLTLDFLKSSELKRYFANLKEKQISYKPQNLSSLSIDLPVIDLLRKRGEVEEIKKLAVELDVEHLLNNKLNKLSGGELQRVAVLAASLGKADIYFFDEPFAFLDIAERVRVSDFIHELSKNKIIVVVEHDLLILDYLTEYLNIFYGQQGCFGAVSDVKKSREGINEYLKGFLKNENIRIRDKGLNFNFTKTRENAGKIIGRWDDFNLKLGDFSLDIKSGEIRENHVIGILGRNGIGKTSFVRALAGEIGNLEFDVSYKPQYLFTDNEDLVRNVIVREKIDNKLRSSFNLGILEQKKIKDLSGGELQRFSIARCLAKNSDVYLIDEPSAYLDVEERIKMARIIKEFMKDNEKTCFVVDHDLLLMSYLADSVMVFFGEPGKRGVASEIMNFEKGISELLKSLDITLRKDKDSGRPRINKKGSVLDREQKARGEWAVL